MTKEEERRVVEEAAERIVELRREDRRYVKARDRVTPAQIIQDALGPGAPVERWAALARRAVRRARELRGRPRSEPSPDRGTRAAREYHARWGRGALYRRLP